MSKSKRRIVVLAIAGLMSGTTMSFAQTNPIPDSTRPGPPNPQSKPGATIVINPTLEECKGGWNGKMKWTKKQFEAFCTRLGTSK